ncbi:hypothetical protein Dvina_02020 [Dactylosporangium vinaceum]|uniref:Uncharacterized protein n=1 Tax=Dactylosporangium vinaceum TaxID=53362 RepID=A0ABV5MF24_9ACTN|nr:hypothetical protein [Dactylosporangium vinaceum]UAB97013.1 hypothetical protein Dvina_02020 [Dactylosporangium vinaceum]
MTAIKEPGPKAEAPEQDDGTADDARSLSPQTIRSYGISDSEFLGPSAFGPNSTSIGAILNVGRDREKRRSVNRPLDGGLVLERMHTYAETATPDRLVGRLNHRSVAYLSGPPGSGRFTAALVGLARRHPANQITQVYLVGDDPLHTYYSDPELLRSGYGHIVELAPAVKPDFSELAQLSALAQAARASIVFVSADTGHGLVDYRVEHESPEPGAVFLAWLERRLRDRGHCIDACLPCDGECVRRYVEYCRAEYLRLLSVTTMTDAVRFAADFAERRPDPGNAADLLADSASVRNRAIELFKTAQPPDEASRDRHRLRRAAQHRRAARLAFAVFDGYPLTRVFAATSALMRRLDDAAGRAASDRTVLEHNLDDLLDEIRSDAQPDGVVGAARIARLRQPRLVRGLLDVAWHEYDTARQPLLRWLDDLTETGDVRPVAAAAGLLCEYDFKQVHHDLLDKWAVSPQPSRRQAAALACELAVRNPALTSRVLECVAGWVQHPGYRRDTAVRTYATNTFRRGYALEALAVLEVAAHDAMQNGSNAIPVGIRGIYDTHPAEVVKRLVDWADSEIPNLRNMASRCLIRLAAADSDAVGASSTRAWPMLLHQTVNGDVAAADHARLWPNALLHPKTARQAWPAVERWIRLSADDAQLRDVFRLVFGPIFREGPINRRADFYLRCFWRRSMPDSPILDTVAEMLQGASR